MARGDEVDPPQTVTVDAPAPLLWTFDEKPIRRQIGFTMLRHIQTTGTNPPLYQGGKKITPRKGGSKGGKKGC